MSQIVAVRCRIADPITYAPVIDLEVPKNQYVVIQKDKGQEMG